MSFTQMYCWMMNAEETDVVLIEIHFNTHITSLIQLDSLKMSTPTENLYFGRRGMTCHALKSNHKTLRF